jgi:uncharacterized protein YjiS (DUF1127 family)
MRHKKKPNDQRNRLFITQAAYVYEMADIVLEILDKIGLEGKKDIEALYQDYQQKIKYRNQEIQEELQKINQAEETQKIDKPYADNLRGSYQHMQRANEIGLNAWQQVMDKVQRQDNWVNQTKQMRTRIELKRKQAQLQLATLRDIGILKGTIAIVDNMEEWVNNVGNMELWVLDENTVRQLIFGNTQLKRTDLK